MTSSNFFILYSKLYNRKKKAKASTFAITFTKVSVLKRRLQWTKKAKEKINKYNDWIL